MKQFTAIPIMAFVGALFAVMASANAQDMDDDEVVIQNFNIFPTQVIGQTCVESEDKDTKCLTLNPGDAGTFIPAATLEVATHGARDVLIQFCAKVEDEMFQELECQAVVDNSMTPAPPGAVKPTENPNDTIYVFCMSWFGQTAGVGKGDSTVDIECTRKKNVASTVVNINDYTATVFSK